MDSRKSWNPKSQDLALLAVRPRSGFLRNAEPATVDGRVLGGDCGKAPTRVLLGGCQRARAV